MNTLEYFFFCALFPGAIDHCTNESYLYVYSAWRSGDSEISQDWFPKEGFASKRKSAELRPVWGNQKGTAMLK